jgi:hypothetical protein
MLSLQEILMYWLNFRLPRETFLKYQEQYYKKSIIIKNCQFLIIKSNNIKKLKKLIKI